MKHGIRPAFCISNMLAMHTSCGLCVETPYPCTTLPGYLRFFPQCMTKTKKCTGGTPDPDHFPCVIQCHRLPPVRVSIGDEGVLSLHCVRRSDVKRCNLLGVSEEFCFLSCVQHWRLHFLQPHTSTYVLLNTGIHVKNARFSEVLLCRAFICCRKRNVTRNSREGWATDCP